MIVRAAAFVSQDFNMKKKYKDRHKNCTVCNSKIQKYTIKGLCDSCYFKSIWRTNKKRREHSKMKTYEWRDKHPERWKAIQTKAMRKQYKKNRAGLLMYRQFYHLFQKD